MTFSLTSFLWGWTAREGCRVVCLLQSRLYQIIICSVCALSFPSCGARFALTNMLASRSDKSHADSLEISRFRRWRDGIAQGHLPRLYFVGPSTIHPLTALYRFFYHLSLNGIRNCLFCLVNFLFVHDHLEIVEGSWGFLALGCPSMFGYLWLFQEIYEICFSLSFFLG